MKTVVLPMLAAAVLATVAGPADSAVAAGPPSPTIMQASTDHVAHRTVGFEQCRRGGGHPVRKSGYWWCEGGRYDGQMISGG
ncbi:hypothetical protein [Actinomadura chibensis]|uniref:Uncharacterized protein n=1 Tax=Actinomadura chibensis TaxID=392828 RepID=A0A5D0N3D4_9ACTN|nr:hypothetical protein [Actinomadura chibensis]TYB38873.1 hypothetical protein FXF69_41105 [Actinomadura chibensis]